MYLKKMEKESILVRDNKGFFLKMFKRRFKDDFNFFENSFLYRNKNEAKEYDRSIFVIYDKDEMIDFLKLEKKGANIMVCFFNKQLYESMYFFEEIKSLILVDCSKTKGEIIKELKLHFSSKLNSMAQVLEKNFPASNFVSIQLDDYYKAVFFSM